MLRHYIRVALRNLRKNKTSTFIHLTGLSLSIGFCLLLFGYIRHEQSYDGFHIKKDRLFRLEMTDMWSGKKKAGSGTKKDGEKNDDKVGLVFPVIVAGDMANSLPEVESVVRFKDEGSPLVRINNRIFKEKDLLYADSNFFEVFSFPLVKGDPANALRSIHSVVLSETTAKKYFGDRNPIGQTLSLVNDSARLYTVSGVAKDAPVNSSIQFDWVIPTLSDPDYADNLKERFNHMNTLMAVVLKPGVDPNGFEIKMNEWVKGYFVEPFVKEYGQWLKDADFSTYRWHIRPLAECHYNPSEPWGHYTNSRNIYVLSCLAVVILLIAALNYVLLSVAGVAARAQEASVRKVMGAGKTSILLQFWVETQLLVLAAVGAGMLLAWVLMPMFNMLLDAKVSWRQLPLTDIVLAILGLSFALGIVAGYYPALLMARMKAVSVLKGTGTFKINPRLSRVLVVLQYTACIILMMAAFIMNRQMHYISHKDLGFDRDQVIIVNNPTWDGNFTRMLRTRLYNFARNQPEISAWSGMNGGLNGSYNTNGFKLHGQQQWLYQLTVDYDYFKLMNVPLVKGRFFSPDFPMDTARATRGCVVNETLFSLLGKDAQIGRYDTTIRAVIVGVCKDYHVESLTKKIGPVQHVLPWNGYLTGFLLKVRPGGVPRALAELQKEWKTITQYPLEYTFLDQQVADMYESEARWEKVITYSCLFALFIACLGLFGLSAINAANRTREIGIRKVLGATVTNIFSSLSLQFLSLVLVSLVIAIPVSLRLMSGWLEDFAYRIDIRWWMFGLIGAVAVATALVTVSYQSIRAAMANPVNSLRNE